MRHYLPGLGRFISRVHLHQAVAMGKTTYQELRDVWGINIGPMGTAEAFANNGVEVPEHPNTYAGNNPIGYVDPSGSKWVNPNDPRWPKRPDYPSSAWNAFYCHIAPYLPCIQRTVSSTYAILARHPGLPGDQGEIGRAHV